jgi:hypothetical protein
MSLVNLYFEQSVSNTPVVYNLPYNAIISKFRGFPCFGYFVAWAELTVSYYSYYQVFGFNELHVGPIHQLSKFIGLLKSACNSFNY